MARPRRLTGAQSVSDALEDALRSVAPPSRDWQPRAGALARTFARETDDGMVLVAVEMRAPGLGRGWAALAGRVPVVDGDGHVEMHGTAGAAQRAADALAERMMADEQEAERLSRMEAAAQAVRITADYRHGTHDPGRQAIADAVVTMLDALPEASSLLDALDRLSQATAAVERAMVAARPTYSDVEISAWLYAWNEASGRPFALSTPVPKLNTPTQHAARVSDGQAEQ